MKTPPTRSSAQPNADWLRNCGFQSRHDPVIHGVAPGILSQNIEKPAKNILSSFPPIVETETSKLPGRQIFPLAEFKAQPESRSKANQPPAVANDVLSEMHSLRQLSAGVFCPETNRDCIPELVLFGLIALLGMAWPILSMLGVMGHHH
jgi:hypothetical protein